MTSIVVFGSNGMLGTTLTRVLSEEFGELVETNRQKIPVLKGNVALHLDVTREFDLDRIFQDIEIDFAINAIGMIRQSIDSNNPLHKSQAELINTIFPIRLSEFATRRNIKLIQIGTDCVFSGARGDYSEDDEKDPVDLYGETKKNGEVLSQNSMLIRTSIIGKEFGTSKSLVEWVLSQKVNSEINGFVDHIWNGTTTFHFAKVVAGIIRTEQFEPGVFHLVPANKVSKFSLVSEIANVFNRQDLRILESRSGNFTDRSLRTIHVKNNDLMWRLAGFSESPRIEDMLRQYADWETPRA